MSDFEQDVDDFEKALASYKQRHGRMFPTCSEILEVARDVGYRRDRPETECCLKDSTSAVELPEAAENLEANT